ncbi:MAG: MotA/TolQ/ExbB proton channel family protein [Planctomycetota bacterium]|jgi:biopolymer transport protein ExbB
MDQFLEPFGRVMERGGPVMVPLLVLSVVGLGLVAERIWFWWSVHRGLRARGFQELLAALRSGHREAASSIAAREGGPYGRVAARLLADGAGDGVAIEAVEEVRPNIERFMTALSTIVTAAPLIGILGTVVGIIQSFELLGSADRIQDPGVVARGIATALLTTAGGLVVALLVLFPFMAFRAQVDRALGRLEALAAAAREGQDRANPAAVRGAASAETGARPEPEPRPVGADA